MNKAIKQYWQIRLMNLKKTLEANNFEVFIADNRTRAKEIVLEDILPKIGAKSVLHGGSMTLIVSYMD